MPTSNKLEELLPEKAKLLEIEEYGQVLLERLCERMRSSGLKLAKELYGGATAEVLSGNWEGSHFREFIKYVCSERRDIRNEFEDYLPRSKNYILVTKKASDFESGFANQNARVAFEALALAQDKYLIEVLTDFIIFCRDKGYPLLEFQTIYLDETVTPPVHRIKADPIGYKERLTKAIKDLEKRTEIVKRQSYLPYQKQEPDEIKEQPADKESLRKEALFRILQARSVIVNKIVKTRNFATLHWMGDMAGILQKKIASQGMEQAILERRKFQKSNVDPHDIEEALQDVSICSQSCKEWLTRYSSRFTKKEYSYLCELENLVEVISTSMFEILQAGASLIATSNTTMRARCLFNVENHSRTAIKRAQEFNRAIVELAKDWKIYEDMRHEEVWFLYVDAPGTIVEKLGTEINWARNMERVATQYFNVVSRMGGQSLES